MDLVEAIRLISLRLVVNSQSRKSEDVDPDYELRKIFRWYSKTFCTPLDRVEELPIVDILSAYFEETYEELAAEDPSAPPGSGMKRLMAEKNLLLEAPEDLKRRQKEADEEDLDLHLMGQDEVDRQIEQSKTNAIRKLEDATNMLQGLSNRPIQRDKEAQLVTTPISRMTEVPQDIHLTFSDEDIDLDSDPMTFGLLDPPKSKAR